MKRVENSKGTAARLLKILLKDNPVVILVFILIIVSALANAAGSMFIKRLIDDYIAPLLLADNPVFTGLLYAIVIMGVIYTVGVSSTYLFNRLMAGVSQKTLKKLRDEMFAHMQSLPVKYYDTHSSGDIMSLYTNDTDTLREFLSQSLAQIVSSAATVIAVTVLMLILNLIFSALVFLCVVLMLFVSRKLSARAAVYFRKQQGVIGGLNGYIEEMVNGQKVIKVFCHEEAVKSGFKERNVQLRASSVQANKYINILMPVMIQLGTVQYVLIAVLGGIMAIYGFGGVTVGTIAAFLLLTRSFSAPIGQISSQVNIVITALAGAERIFKFLDEPVEADNGYVTLVKAEYIGGELTEPAGENGVWAWRHPHSDGTVTYTEVKGEVCFYDVDFGYDPGKIVLHGVSLHAKPGQKIAFVGATGAGKTTITNLINRFYDIADGKIRYDGININKIRKHDLRRSLGIVLQDTHLFSGTIADNIRYGKTGASDTEVVNAALLANAHGFIMRLPRGYDTEISGDGSSLSGGQRQLIAIARAAIANAPVMILDEATSSIDTRTEALVQKGMDALMQGRTVFVIAHRLSTVKNSDAIAVLEQGRIIESGNHGELIAKKGKYYQLYTGGLE